MTLKDKLTSLTALSFLDAVFTRLLGMISFIVLVRLLPRSDIGIIGLASGYMVIIAFISLQPETVLLRDFPKIRDKLNLYVSSFMAFWFIRTIFIMGLAGLISLFLYNQFESFLVSIFFLASALFFNIGMFQTIIKELFYVDFKQKILMIVNIVLTVISIGLILLLYFKPTLLFYIFISFVSASIGFGTWYFLLRKYFSFNFYFTKDNFKVIKDSIADFALWQHLNGAITYMIYRVDTAIIGFFTTLTVVGDYTIGLAVANFFFFVPQIIQKSVMVGLSNLNKKEDEGLLMSLTLKYSFILALAQLLFFIVFGKFIIQILFTSQHLDQIYLYALLIICGVTLLNIVRPLMSLIAAKCSLKDGFFQVYLPGGIIALSGYTLLTHLYGPFGTAIGNITGYFFFGLLLFMFTRKKYPLDLKFKILVPEEKEILKGLFYRFLKTSR